MKQTKFSSLVTALLVSFGFFSTAGAQITGVIDGISKAGSTSYINGWACDQKQKQSITVHIYTGGGPGVGTILGGFVAQNPDDPGVDQACGTTGIPHRYSIPIDAATALRIRGQAVYAYGISVSNGPNNSLYQSGTFKVPDPDVPVVGKIELVQVNPDGVVITGWACEKNMAGTVRADLYVGGAAGVGIGMGSATANLASGSAADQACATTGVSRGFQFKLSAASLQGHWGQSVNVHGISLISGVANDLIANSGALFLPKSLPQPAMAGNFDGFQKNATTNYLSGWACQVGQAGSISVQVYAGAANNAGGTLLGTYPAATLNEAEVSAACGVTTLAHRFSIPVDAATALKYLNQPLFIYGVPLLGSVPVAIGNGAGNLRIPNPDVPVMGAIDGVSITGDAANIFGWACQKNLAQPIDIHVYAGGAAGVGTLVAGAKANDHVRPDVSAVCNTSGIAHAFQIPISSAQLKQFMGQGIYIHGISQIAGASNDLIGNSGNVKFPVTLGSIYQPGQNLVIPAGTDVLLDRNLDVALLQIQGRLICPANSTAALTVAAQGIQVYGVGSAFQCGTAAAPFAGTLDIQLKPGLTVMGSERSFVVFNSGTLQLTGRQKNLTWVRLGERALANSKTVVLNAPTDWSAGDQIAISSSTYDPHQAEQMTIASVASDKKTLTFTAALKFDHWGGVQTYWSGGHSYGLEESSEVADLSRSIRIAPTGDPAAMKSVGGHVMIMKSAFAYVDAVELTHMGQMGVMARYPFHWHRAGDVTGQFFKNSSIHSSFQRCVTVHGTNNSLVQNNVCYDHYGHGFFLEDGNETGNHFVSNLSILAKKPLPELQLLTSDSDTSSLLRWAGPANFWISNPNNDFQGNVAAGSEGSGFWMSFVDQVLCDDTACKVTTQGNGNVFPSHQPMPQFDGNSAHSNIVGLAIDGTDQGELTNNPLNPNDRLIVAVHYSPPSEPLFNRVSLTKSRNAGSYIRGQSMLFTNSIFADNGVSGFFSYNQKIQDSAIIASSANQTTKDLDYLIANGSPTAFSGMWIYDGPFVLKNVAMIGFSPADSSYSGRDTTSVPFRSVGGANRWTNTTQGLSFNPEPAHRLLLTGDNWLDTPYSLSVRDLDGTLTGTANSVVVMDQAINKDASCVAMPGTGAVRCAYERGMLYIPMGFSTFQVKRASDGAASRDMSTFSVADLFAKVGFPNNPAETYEIDFPAGYSLNTYWPMNFQAESLNVRSPLLKFKQIGNNCSVAGAAAVGSLAEVQNANSSVFFVSGRDVYVRLLVTDRDGTASPDMHATTHAFGIGCSN